MVDFLFQHSPPQKELLQGHWHSWLLGITMIISDQGVFARKIIRVQKLTPCSWSFLQYFKYVDILKRGSYSNFISTAVRLSIWNQVFYFSPHREKIVTNPYIKDTDLSSPLSTETGLLEKYMRLDSLDSIQHFQPLQENRPEGRAGQWFSRTTAHDTVLCTKEVL